ncbi:MAG: ABC transporter permease [Erysipelotrichales bacterium]|nr:ABC transporter permease [Erysipelotrichales bacterium]
MKQPWFKEPKKRKKQGPRLGLYKLLGSPFYFILIFLITLPMFMVLLYAITEPASSLLIFRFSFRSFSDFFQAAEFVRVFFDSLLLAFITTLIALLIGYPAAYFITKLSKKNQMLIILLISIPMWFNMMLRLIAWRQILDEQGPIHWLFGLVGIQLPRLLGTDFAIVLGMIYVFLPFMIIPIFTILSKIDPKLLEASNDLGANKAQTFRKVIIPLSIPGILTGITMVFLPAATSIAVPHHLSAGQRRLIGHVIEAQFLGDGGNWHLGSAIAIVLALVILLLISLTKILDRSKE